MEQLLEQMTVDDKRKLAFSILYNDKGDDRKMAGLKYTISKYYNEYISTDDNAIKQAKADNEKKTQINNLKNNIEGYEKYLNYLGLIDFNDVENDSLDIMETFEGIKMHKEELEKILSNDNINTYIDEQIFNKIITCYKQTKSMILNYDIDIIYDEYNIKKMLLKKAIKLLINNPNLSINIKNSSNYEEIKNKLNKN
jgi:hypothetical protein